MKGSDTLRFLVIGLAIMILTLAVGAVVLFFSIQAGLLTIVLGSLAAMCYGLSAMIIFLSKDDGNI